MAKLILSRKAAVAQGALMAYLQPKLAMDAKIDLGPIVGKLTAKNFAASKPVMLAAVAKACEGKLAADASIEDLAGLLDTLEATPVAEGIDGAATDPGSYSTGAGSSNQYAPGAPESGLQDAQVQAGAAMSSNNLSGDNEGADPIEALKTFLADKIGPEDQEALATLLAAIAAPADPDPAPAAPAPGEDEDDEAAEAARLAAEEEALKAKEKDMVSKPAMDAAIKAHGEKVKAEVVAAQRAITNAEKAIRPHVGELAIACDSADEVYRAALEMLNVPTKGVHPSAFPALLAMVPVPGAKPARPTRIAQDAAAAKDFTSRFPGAAAIRLM